MNAGVLQIQQNLQGRITHQAEVLRQIGNQADLQGRQEVLHILL